MSAVFWPQKIYRLTYLENMIKKSGLKFRKQLLISDSKLSFTGQAVPFFQASDN
jgi:hypothetical protein